MTNWPLLTEGKRNEGESMNMEKGNQACVECDAYVRRLPISRMQDCSIKLCSSAKNSTLQVDVAAEHLVLG